LILSDGAGLGVVLYVVFAVVLGVLVMLGVGIMDETGTVSGTGTGVKSNGPNTSSSIDVDFAAGLLGALLTEAAVLVVVAVVTMDVVETPLSEGGGEASLICI